MTGTENNAADENEELAEEVPRPPSTPLDANIAMRCVLKNKLERFTKCFEDEEDPFHQTVAEMIEERDDNGKTPLEMAAILGRVELANELIARGAEVNKQTSAGYTPLHHASCWGKIDCLKALVDSGADLQLRTSHGERARETAMRYNQTECVDFLDWAEARAQLLDTISCMRDTIADPEKVQGRLGRDDKNLALSVCTEKSDWLENTPGAVTQDFITQKQSLSEALAPIWAKLSEPPPEKPEKK